MGAQCVDCRQKSYVQKQNKNVQVFQELGGESIVNEGEATVGEKCRDTFELAERVSVSCNWKIIEVGILSE